MSLSKRKNDKIIKRLSASAISNWYRRRKLAQALEVYQNFIFKHEIDLEKYFDVKTSTWDHCGLMNDIEIIKKRKGFLDDLIESSDDEYEYQQLPGTPDSITPLLSDMDDYSEDEFAQDIMIDESYIEEKKKENNQSFISYILSFIF